MSANTRRSAVPSASRRVVEKQWARARRTLGIKPIFLISALLVAPSAARAEIPAAVAELTDTACIACHGNAVVTPLDMRELDFDLDDGATRRTWERVYDRVASGQMPPVGAPRPDDAIADKALARLEAELIAANERRRNGQRTPLKRLTRLEYAYTIEDLLGLDREVAQHLGTSLPAEADAGGFDNVAARQGISPLHIRSYLAAADGALDAAIRVSPSPERDPFVIDYAKSGYLNFMSNAEILGGGITKNTGDGIAMFFDVGSTYLMHSASEGFHVTAPGRYRVTMEARAYQPTSPITLTVYRGTRQGATMTASLDDLIGSFDLIGDDTRTVEVETYLRPGELVSPSVADLAKPEGDYTNYFAPEINIRDYAGEGIVMQRMTIEGPLVESWPPPSTRNLLGVDFDMNGNPEVSKPVIEHVRDIVARFGRRAFRRPLTDAEHERFTSLAEPHLEAGFVEAARVPLKAMLSAPQFIYQGGRDDLNDFDIASRLSYFLWRSTPDDELLALAEAGKLADDTVVADQVERLLSDPKHERFVKDFAGQALRLYEMKATSPDPGLYPEYDDRLGLAMRRETELYVGDLIDNNLTIDAVIDSDFTYLNRRIASHYGIEGVEGQAMRRVALPADSPRGGVLSQASVHKITANGTTTSPVPRGNFVLANILGRPAPPPPPGIPGLEPDTRGATTIREQLTAHRANPTCATCHQTIDPPGFALESFDPIGGFRSTYRVSGGVMEGEGFTVPLPYKQGLPVDSSGETTNGHRFADFEAYKDLLLETERDAIATHFISQFVTLATGSEVDFADRRAIDAIRESIAPEYRVRDMLHAVVKSDLFKTR